jgi:hypothetical protein
MAIIFITKENLPAANYHLKQLIRVVKAVSKELLH